MPRTWIDALVRIEQRQRDMMDIQEVGCGVWTGSSWLRLGQIVGTCECDNEPSGSIKCGEILD